MFERTLEALATQRLEPSRPVELVVCDSGSRDGTVELARRFGAEVFQIPPETFSHGATRNLLMERSAGDHVAFLTQDAVPADDLWLQRLLDGFSAADDIALVYGPYRPAPEASLMVARELTEWFARLAPDGGPRVDRLEPSARQRAARELYGPRTYFTDANGCIARAAWRAVPFRPIPYAEDHALAVDMLQAGYAKVFEPRAAVVHSHDYSLPGWIRREFDEARAVRDVYGYAAPISARAVTLRLRGLVGADWRWADARGQRSARLLVRSTIHHVARTAGWMLGGHAERLPAAMVRRLSLEGRS